MTKSNPVKEDTTSYRISLGTKRIALFTRGRECCTTTLHRDAACCCPAEPRNNMAMRTRTVTLLLLSALMIASGASRDETGSLLAFKAELTGHGSDVVLPSWNSSQP